MEKYLLIFSVLGMGIAQASSAAIDNSSNSTLTYTRASIPTSYGSSQNMYNYSDSAHVSSDDEINQAINKLSAHATKKESQLTDLTRRIESESFNEIREWAEQGSAKYQGKLALKYENGDEVEQDYKKSLEWLRKSADQGYAISESMLGLKYYTGEGIRQDYNKALEWLRKAVKHEDEPRFEAEIMLGLMYELGQGVRKNRVTAKEWYGKSCDNGYQDGCNQYRRVNLGEYLDE